MSGRAHPRFEERRREVGEHRTSRRLALVAGLLLVLALAGLGFWLINSPFLEIKRVEVTGIDRGRALTLVESVDVAVGDPIVWVRPGRVERALLADPWISDARVEVGYPNDVRIAVVQHEPVAWVGAGGGWVQAAATGAVVAAQPDPPPEGSTIATDLPPLQPGDVVIDPVARAGLEFIASLRSPYRDAVALSVEGDAMTARVGGYAVRLGGPRDMAAKAAAFTAVVADGVPDGAFIDLLAPARPAVTVLSGDEAADATDTEANSRDDVEVEGNE